MISIVKKMLAENVNEYVSILNGNETIRGNRVPGSPYIDAGMYKNIEKLMRDKKVENIPLLNINSYSSKRNKGEKEYNNLIPLIYRVVLWYNKPTGALIMSSRDNNSNPYYSNNYKTYIVGFISHIKNMKTEYVMQYIEKSILNNIVYKNNREVSLTQSKGVIDNILKPILTYLDDILVKIYDIDQDMNEIKAWDKRDIYVPKYMIKLMMYTDMSGMINICTPYVPDSSLCRNNIFVEDITMDSDILIVGDGKNQNDITKIFGKSYIVREVENGRRIIRICTLDDNSITNDIKIDIDSESTPSIIYRLDNNIFRYSYNYENFRRGIALAILKDSEEYFERYRDIVSLLDKREHRQFRITAKDDNLCVIDGNIFEYTDESRERSKVDGKIFYDDFIIETDVFKFAIQRYHDLVNENVKGKLDCYSLNIQNKKFISTDTLISDTLMDIAKKVIYTISKLKFVDKEILSLHRLLKEHFGGDMVNEEITSLNLRRQQVDRIRSIINAILYNHPIVNDSKNDFFSSDLFLGVSFNHMSSYIDCKDFEKYKIDVNNEGREDISYVSTKIYLTLDPVFLNVSSKIEYHKLILNINCDVKTNTLALTYKDGDIDIVSKNNEKEYVESDIAATSMVSTFQKNIIKYKVLSEMIEIITNTNLELKINDENIITFVESKKPILQRLCEYLQVIGELSNVNERLIHSNGLMLYLDNKGHYRIKILTMKDYRSVMSGKVEAKEFNVFDPNYVRPRVKGVK